MSYLTTFLIRIQLPVYFDNAVYKHKNMVGMFGLQCFYYSRFDGLFSG